MPNKTWATNDVVTASDLNTQYRDQVITTCTSGTRPTGTEGQHIYETDTDREYVYSGSGWVEWGGIGAWTTFTPTITQSGSVTFTNTYSKYFKIGRMVTWQTFLTITGTGTANNAVNITVPFTAATAGGRVVGNGEIFDASAGFHYNGAVWLTTTTAVQFVNQTAPATVFMGTTGSDFAAALAATDSISFTVTYESAS